MCRKVFFTVVPRGVLDGVVEVWEDEDNGEDILSEERVWMLNVCCWSSGYSPKRAVLGRGEVAIKIIMLSSYTKNLRTAECAKIMSTKIFPQYFSPAVVARGISLSKALRLPGPVVAQKL